MSTYERSGRTEVPQWWLDKVIPVLNSPDTKNKAIALAASAAAGRRSPWGGDAISKFKSGEVRTIELANGLSDVLKIPRPFHVARSEQAAIAMTAIDAAGADPKNAHGSSSAAHLLATAAVEVAAAQHRDPGKGDAAPQAPTTATARRLAAADRIVADGTASVQNAAGKRSIGVQSRDGQRGDHGGGSRRPGRGRS